MTPSKRPPLGKGLDGLFGGPAGETKRKDVLMVPVEDLHPLASQPRKRFDETKLAELAESIREQGVLQPVLARPRAAGGYELVSGERRWRASQRAGLREIPAYIRELTDAQVSEAQLVENLQRDDLSPVELARGFQRLIDVHGHTQDVIAKRVGKDRSTIANALRLLKLPPPVLEKIETKELSEGHGRALLGAPDVTTMQKLAREALAKGWSVREVERRAKAATQATGDAQKKPGKPLTRSVNVLDLEQRLTRSLGAPVRVADRKGKGHLTVSFSSYDELDRLIERFTS